MLNAAFKGEGSEEAHGQQLTTGGVFGACRHHHHSEWV